MCGNRQCFCRRMHSSVSEGFLTYTIHQKCIKKSKVRESEDKLWPLLPLLTYYQACQCLHTSCVLPMLLFWISVMSIHLSDVQGFIPTVKGRSYILFLFYSISDPAL